MIFSQIFKDNNCINNNNSNNNTSNLNKLNNVTRSIDINKTPVSGNSQNSINNFNTNNIIINNKFNSEVSKPITNLNMIFKFKTILNEDVNVKINKKDPTKIMRNPSNNKNNKKEKNEINKIIDNKRIIDSKDYNSQTKSNEKKELIYQNNNFDNKIKNNHNSAKNMYDHDLNNYNQNIFSVNSTLKSGHYTSKNVSQSSKLNILKNFDPLKFSINQLQDLLSSQNNNENQKSNNKSSSKSKGKVGNLGNNSKKYSSNL